MEDETKTTAAAGADETANKETGTATPEGGEQKHDDAASKETKQEPEKTFTQAELDRIVKERIARASKDAPSKEDLAAFKTWQESQKSEAQKQADALSQAQSAADLAQAELARYKQLEAVRKSGVDEKFVGYVNFEVEQLAKTGSTGFDEALVSFLKTNANYKKQETREVKVDTGAKEKPAEKPPVEFNFLGVRPRK